MFLFYFSIILAIISNVFYHVFQKNISETVNPTVSLIVTYSVALICSIFLFFLYPNRENIIVSLKEINWSSYALGFAIIGLEIGFLLAYRAGWKMNIASLLANAIVALLILPVGVFFYKENISFINYIGIVLSIIGLTLVSYK